MEKILAFLTILALSISLCACGSSTSSTSDEKTPEDIARHVAERTVDIHYMFVSGVKNSWPSVSSIEQISDNEFKVYGKTIIVDDYGDRWEAKFDGVVKVEGDDGTMYDEDYGDPIRK